MQNDTINAVYNVLGDALWEVFTKNQRDNITSRYDDFIVVTHALANALDRGSICFIADAELSKAGDHLLKAGLAMTVTQAKQTENPVLDELAPIVFDHGEKSTRLYWQRNFGEEWRLAKQIAALMKRSVNQLTPNQKTFLTCCQLDHFANHETFIKRQKLLQILEKTSDKKIIAKTLSELWPAVKSSLDQTDAIERLATHAFGIITGGPGTGKTTTTVNLGIGLAREGKKVLLVDADPQGDLTTSLGWPEQDNLSVTLATQLEGIVADREMDSHAGILHHEEGVDLIPSNIELAGLEVMLVNAMSRELTLKNYLNEVKSGYDYVLIDCMPSLGMLTINALAASDSVIVPVQAQYLPAKGMTQLMKTIGKVQRQINPALKVDGVLLTLADMRTNLARVTAESIRQNYGRMVKVYQTVIPVGVKAAETSAAGQSIYSYDKNSTVAKAYASFTREVVRDGERQRNKTAPSRSR